jgi:hypothetical protein
VGRAGFWWASFGSLSPHALLFYWLAPAQLTATPRSFSDTAELWSDCLDVEFRLSIEPTVGHPPVHVSCTTPHRNMAAQADRKSRIFSRREIEAQIANGRSIVIVDSKVLKVDAWLPYHPGGDKAIRHMVGRDATDEVTRYGLPCCLKRLVADLCIQIPLHANARAHEPLPGRPHRGTMDKLPAADTRGEI